LWYNGAIKKKGGVPVSITADLIRGHTDAIILAALLQGDSYGYRINRSMYDMTEGRYELKEATLYTAFRRLEESGYIRSYWGDEATGARRRYYAITPDGRNAYHSMMREWQEASGLLEKLMCFGAVEDNGGDAEQI
jgi:DNA-binding PadR family transcriptional regulator